MIQQTLRSILLVASGAAPAAANVVGITAPILLSPKVATGKIDIIGNGALASSVGYVSNDNVTAEFNVETVVKTSALGVAPELGHLLRLAGLNQTITAEASVAYRLGGVTMASGQLKVFNDDFSRLVTNACCDFKLSGKISEPISASFSVKGTCPAAATAEANPVVVLQQAPALVFNRANTSLSIAGSTVRLLDFEFELGAQIERAYSTTFDSFYISNYEPKFSFTAIKTRSTDEAAWAQLISGGTFPLVLTVGLSGSRVTITMPAAKYENLEENDDQGRISIKRSFILENAGVANNNFTISYV